MKETAVCLLITTISFTNCQLKTQQTAITKPMETTATPSFTTTFLVNQSPEEVFRAINNVRGWWSEEMEGSTDQLNSVFNYHFQDVHFVKMKIIE